MSYPPPRQFAPRRSFARAIEHRAKMDKHVRLLTEARDRLRAAMVQAGMLPARPARPPVLCRLHGKPWQDCRDCSK